MPIDLGLADRSAVAAMVVVVVRRVTSPGPRAGVSILPHWHVLRVRAVRPDMLLHVVLPRKRLVAHRTVHALLARMLFPVPRRMSRRRKRGRAPVAGCVRTRILVLPRPLGRLVLRPSSQRCLGRRGLGHRR